MARCELHLPCWRVAVGVLAWTEGVCVCGGGVIYGPECWLVQSAKQRLIIGREIVAAMKLRRLISPQLISTLLWWGGGTTQPGLRTRVSSFSGSFASIPRRGSRGGMKSLLQDAEGLHVGFNAESLLRAELRNLCAEKVTRRLFSLAQPHP